MKEEEEEGGGWESRCLLLPLAYLEGGDFFKVDVFDFEGGGFGFGALLAAEVEAVAVEFVGKLVGCPHEDGGIIDETCQWEEVGQEVGWGDYIDEGAYDDGEVENVVFFVVPREHVADVLADEEKFVFDCLEAFFRGVFLGLFEEVLEFFGMGGVVASSCCPTAFFEVL